MGHQIPATPKKGMAENMYAKATRAPMEIIVSTTLMPGLSKSAVQAVQQKQAANPEVERSFNTQISDALHDDLPLTGLHKKLHQLTGKDPYQCGNCDGKYNKGNHSPFRPVRIRFFRFAP